MTAGARDTSFEGSYGMNTSTTDEKQQLAAEPRPEKSDLKLFIYNSKTGELFGRTIPSTTQILFYLLLFSACVATLWGLCLWIFYQTLDNYTPKLQTTSSFIGSNPGLGFRPMRLDTDPYSSLIWFRHGGAGDWDVLKENLDRFLAEYEPGYWANAGASQTKCDWNRPPLKKEEACEFNKEWLSDQNSDIKCISEEHYGYFHGKPCILVKLNRIYGWTPEPYFNLTEIERLPDMPKTLKDHITQTWEENCRGRGTEIEDQCPELNMVWLDCNGEMDPDKENIGTVSYTPWRGFPAYFFPYYNQLGYLQPVVMVQMKNPTPGVLVNIQCTAWAKGIDHNMNKRRGSVHFELLMD